MKKEVKTRLALAGARAVLERNRENYQIRDVSVPERGEKDFEKTFVSPFGFLSPYRLDGAVYWELTPMDRKEAIKGANLVRREYESGKNISVYITEEDASDETNLDLDYFHNLTVGRDTVDGKGESLYESSEADDSVGGGRNIKGRRI